MTKDEYEYLELKQMMKDYYASIREIRKKLDIPRCANCFLQKNGVCEIHGAIPQEYMYNETECPDHDSLPF